MGSEGNKQMYALTICGYKKADVTEAAYRDYIVNTHAPLVRDIMAEHGVERWILTHNHSDLREKISTVFPSNGMADYDSIIQILFSDFDKIVSFASAVKVIKKIAPALPEFADVSRNKMTIGLMAELLA